MACCCLLGDCFFAIDFERRRAWLLFRTMCLPESPALRRWSNRGRWMDSLSAWNFVDGGRPSIIPGQSVTAFRVAVVAVVAVVEVSQLSLLSQLSKCRMLCHVARCVGEVSPAVEVL